MSTTNPITQSSSAASAAAAANKGPSSLGVSDFLTLMTTQLKNQDPFKPLDGTEMVSQLAQFGTVSGVQQMNSTLGALSESLRSSQALSGASMVGHEILAPATTANYYGQALGGAVQVADGASSVSMTITDASGQVVRHLNIATASGQQPFSWDGLTDSGSQAAKGNYKIQAVANVGGASVALPVAVAARVGSVSLDKAGTGLTLNTMELGAVALGDVQQII
jgi:flagellar basal-body rod modification protein FlgD